MEREKRKLPLPFLTVVPLVIGFLALLAMTGYEQLLNSSESFFNNLFTIEPLSWAGIYTSLASGAIMGWEREIKKKPVGMRTCILIVMGTYVFVAVSYYSISLMEPNLNSIIDPSRIIGQVMTGIGFLGGGVILARKGSWQGVTSAATVWMLAAVGVCAGLTLYTTCIKLAIISTVVLIAVDSVDGYIAKTTRNFFNHK